MSDLKPESIHQQRDSTTPCDDIYVVASRSNRQRLRPESAPINGEIGPGRAPHIRLDIQGMRAIAVGAVMVFHASPFLSGGFVGVDVFFVISGFVIAGVLHRSNESSPTPLRDFYGRRVKRLMPPAALMSAATLVFGVFTIPFAFQRSVAASALAATLLSSNHWFVLSGSDYFSTQIVYNPFLHTWSLGVEEQFYLVAPALYMVLRRLDSRWPGQRYRLTSLVLGVLAVASFLLSVLGTTQGALSLGSFVVPYRDLAFYSSSTRAWEFLAGFLISGRALQASHRIAGLIRAISMTTLLASFFLFTEDMAFPGWVAIVPVAATVGLLLSGTVDKARSSILSSRPLVAIGDISYGLYLWHWPALILFKFALRGHPGSVPLALISTVGLAVLSYRYLELPLRFTPNLSGLRGSIKVAALCSVPVVVLILAAWGASPILQSTRRASLPPVREYAGAQRRECVEDETHGDWRHDLCSWPIEGRESVFLVGDSHAWAIADKVAEASRLSGYGFQEWTHFGCPFSTAAAIDKPDCADWQRRVLQVILDQKPGLVVVANRSPAYSRAPGENSEVVLEGTPPAKNEQEALAIWETGLRTVVDSVTDAGIPVLLVSTVPEFPQKGRDTVSFLFPTGGLQPLPVEEVTERRGRVAAVEASIAASSPRMQIFDPVPYLCTDVCRQLDGRSWRYFDNNHLTQAGAEPLVEPLRVAISKLALASP